MCVVYYIIGLLICFPYIIYIVIKNRGNLEKTLGQIKETWEMSQEESIKDMDCSFRLRIMLLSAIAFIAFIAFIGINNTKLLNLGLSLFFLCTVLYYIFIPQGVVLHVVRQLKRIYPLKNKAQ